MKGDGRIRWFNKTNRKTQIKEKRTIATRIQRVKARLVANSRVYIQKVEASGTMYTPESFFEVPQTHYERETPLNGTSDELIRYYFESWKSGQHVAEYGDDVNATGFSEGTEWGLNEFNDCLLNKANKGKNLKGITTPYMYFGFGGSSFALHVEDQLLNSCSYLHRGGNKIWFFVPIEYAERPSLKTGRNAKIIFGTKTRLWIRIYSVKPDFQFLKRCSRKVNSSSLFRTGCTLVTTRAVTLRKQSISQRPVGLHTAWLVKKACATKTTPAKRIYR